MRFIKLFFVLALSAQLAGCAFGQKVDYRHAIPSIDISTDATVVVKVVDARPYVTSGKRRESFVGISRGGYYNPFQVTTASGGPLALDLQTAIVTGLKRADINAIRDFDVHAGIPDIDDARTLTVTLKDWKTDTYMRVRFDYDIEAVVKDQKGTTKGSGSNKGSGAVTHMLTAGSDALQGLLEDAAVAAALQAVGVPAPAPETAVKAQPLKAGAEYDACMARVMRITDKQLRVEAMSACDGVAR